MDFVQQIVIAIFNQMEFLMSIFKMLHLVYSWRNATKSHICDQPFTDQKQRIYHLDR